MLSIYPDDIAAGHDVIVTYLYTTGDNATAGQAEVDISNTVCLNYYDTANGVTTTAYADPASGDCATETITTTPITLAEFNAYRYAGGFQFNWVDAIKTNNLGFNIYTALGQSLFKINADLIPSQMVSTLEASEYTSWFDLGQFALADEFYLEDIDIEGKVARHGPFKLSKKPAFNAKSKYVAAPRINWGEVKSKNARARAKNDTSNKGQSKKSNELDDSISVVNISLQEAGLQRISLSELSVVGFRATDMAKGRYLLTNSVGDLVPSRIVSANNGDYLEFVAAIVRRFYSDKAFYQLRHAQKPRSVNEIPTVSSGLSGVASEYYLHTQTLDDDNRYIFTSKIAGDPWMMNRMFARGRTVTSSLVVPVPDAYQGSAAPDAVVTAEFVDGVNFPSEVDHKVDLYANSQLLGSLEFDGAATAEIQQSMSMNGVSDELEVDLTLTEINSPAISIVYTNKVSLTYPRQCVAIDNQLSFDSNDDYFTVRGFSDQRVHAYARSADTLSYIGEFNACNGSIRFAGVDGAHSYPVFGESTLRSPSLDEVTSRDLIELDVEHLVITHPLFSGPELDSYLLAQTGFSIGRSDVVTTDAAAEAEFAALFQNEIMKSKQSYGEAFIQAKKQFAENGGSDFKDILWGVTLLGDPLLAL